MKIQLNVSIYKSLNNQNNNDSKELIKLMENRFIDEEKLKLNLNQEEIIGLGLLELEIMKAKIFKSFKDRIDYEFHLDGHMPPLCVIVQEGCIRGIEIISKYFYSLININ